LDLDAFVASRHRFPVSVPDHNTHDAAPRSEIKRFLDRDPGFPHTRQRLVAKTLFHSPPPLPMAETIS